MRLRDVCATRDFGKIWHLFFWKISPNRTFVCFILPVHPPNITEKSTKKYYFRFNHREHMHGCSYEWLFICLFIHMNECSYVVCELWKIRKLEWLAIQGNCLANYVSNTIYHHITHYLIYNILLSHIVFITTSHSYT